MKIKMKILLVMGPPGSGKGTQASMLKEKYNIAHISTGDIFRAEIAEKTDLGLKAKEYISQGKYVPDEITIGMIEKRVSEDDCSEGFILDGFPRTIPQAEFLDKMLEKQNKKIDYVIYYDVSDEIVVDRIKGRAEKDKIAGKEVRADDLNSDVIKQRLETYHSQTNPVLDYYKKKGIVLQIDASKSVQEIFQESLNKI